MPQPIHHVDPPSRHTWCLGKKSRAAGGGKGKEDQARNSRTESPRNKQGSYTAGQGELPQEGFAVSSSAGTAESPGARAPEFGDEKDWEFFEGISVSFEGRSLISADWGNKWIKELKRIHTLLILSRSFKIKTEKICQFGSKSWQILGTASVCHYGIKEGSRRNLRCLWSP